MTFLLREVLLGALGIDSDLNWGTDENGISAIDLKLLPPGSGSLIARITELGKVLQRLEKLTDEQSDDPYKQAIYDSVDNYLDSYRSTILQADQEICSELLTTLTGLVARLEPFQHELLVVDEFLSSLLSAKPLEMLNKIHDIVVTSPPPIDKKLSVIEHSLHQVTIAQLDGYIYFHQKLPDIFEFKDGRIIYQKGGKALFIDARLSNLLLLIVNVTSDCTDLFNKTDPPMLSDLQQWINVVSHVMSALLSQRLKQTWPSYYKILSSILFTGRSDLISSLARRMLNPHTTGYDISATITSFELPLKINANYRNDGLTLTCVLQPPLNLVVTDKNQEIIGNMSRFFIMLNVSEEALKDIWILAKSLSKSYRYVSLLQMLVKTIKDYIVFSIITPALCKLDPTGEKITDYLKFTAEFGNFIGFLISSFPYDSIELYKAMNQFSNEIVGLRTIILKKVKKVTDKQFLAQITTNTQTFVDLASTIKDCLNINTEESIAMCRMVDSITSSLEQFHKIH